MGVFGLWGKSRREPAKPVSPPSPLALNVGDIVLYDDSDWIIQQKLTYRQGGYTWYDYQLVDVDRKCWLSAEDDDGLFTAVYNDVRCDIPNPPPRTLDVEGHTFHLDEAGECDVRVESEFSAPTTVHVKYWDYEAEDGQLLSIEAWEGDWDASIGREVSPAELDLLPRERSDGPSR